MPLDIGLSCTKVLFCSVYNTTTRFIMLHSNKSKTKYKHHLPCLTSVYGIKNNEEKKSITIGVEITTGVENDLFSMLLEHKG